MHTSGSLLKLAADADVAGPTNAALRGSDLSSGSEIPNLLGDLTKDYIGSAGKYDACGGTLKARHFQSFLSEKI